MKIKTEISPYAEYLTNVHILLLSTYNKLLPFCYCSHMDPDIYYTQACDGQDCTITEVTHSPRSRFQQVVVGDGGGGNKKHIWSNNIYFCILYNYPIIFTVQE